MGIPVSATSFSIIVFLYQKQSAELIVNDVL